MMQGEEADEGPWVRAPTMAEAQAIVDRALTPPQKMRPAHARKVRRNAGALFGAVRAQYPIAAVLAHLRCATVTSVGEGTPVCEVEFSVPELEAGGLVLWRGALRDGGGKRVACMSMNPAGSPTWPQLIRQQPQLMVEVVWAPSRRVRIRMLWRTNAWARTRVFVVPMPERVCSLGELRREGELRVTSPEGLLVRVRPWGASDGI